MLLDFSKKTHLCKCCKSIILQKVASMNNSTMPGNDASPKNIADGNNIDIKPIDDFPGPDSAAGGQHESGNGSNSMPAPSGSSTCGPSNENLNTNANAGTENFLSQLIELTI